MIDLDKETYMETTNKEIFDSISYDTQNNVLKAFFTDLDSEYQFKTVTFNSDCSIKINMISNNNNKKDKEIIDQIEVFSILRDMGINCQSTIGSIGLLLSDLNCNLVLDSSLYNKSNNKFKIKKSLYLRESEEIIITGSKKEYYDECSSEELTEKFILNTKKEMSFIVGDSVSIDERTISISEAEEMLEQRGINAKDFLTILHSEKREVDLSEYLIDKVAFVVDKVANKFSK
jgi:hypothetical protein